MPPRDATSKSGASWCAPLRAAARFILCLGCLLALGTTATRATEIYEANHEFFASGDFNGDGQVDALVLDKITGNVRVGYQDVGGALNWSAVIATGVEGAGALAVGRFAQTNRDSIVVTAPALNRLHLLNLSGVGDPGPTVLHPAHPASTMLVGLDAPYGETAERAWLNVGSSDPGITLLDLFAFLGEGLMSFQDQIAADGFLSSGKALRRTANDATLLAAIRRGSNDTFVAYAYTNTSAPVLMRPNLPAGSEYGFGHFHNEPHPQFLFYVPGQSNISVQPLQFNGATFTFGVATVTSFNSAVQRVYFVNEGTNGVALVHFGDGLVGLRPPSGGGNLQVAPGLGLDTAGNEIRGVVPLGAGKFALLSGASNSVVSTTAQVFTLSGGTYTLTSSNNLPSPSNAGTRGNVWLFQLEPFASSAATVIGSLSAPAWSSAISGLPATLAIRVESDGGVTTGLGNPATNNVGAPPAGTAYVLPNQYRDDISFFGYAPARPPEPSILTIAPPPGVYLGPIQISFSKQTAADDVYYRLGGSSPWLNYAAPFALTNDATIEFYGSTPGGTKSRSQFATYSLGNPFIAPEAPVTVPGSDTNPPPALPPGVPQISPGGTVFYSRQAAQTNSIWGIHLDGTGEKFITAGREPRLSPDGRWMAFRRENDPLPNQHSLWRREVPTGLEARWFTSSNSFAGYNWLNGSSNLIFALNGQFWQLGLTGAPVAYPLATDTRQGAPHANPVDGRIAFQVIYPGNFGLYLAPPELTSRQNLGLNILSPRWPAWAPQGDRIVVADDPSISTQLAAGRNLWVVKPAAPTSIHQITSLTGNNDGFPNGAVWSSDGHKLVGAGRIGGINGVWVLPLAADGSACHCPPRLLPTSAGPDIDFVGGVINAAPSISYTNLGLFIRLEPEVMVVYWSTNYDGFTLQSALELPAGLSWAPVSGPYFRAGPYFEYREPRAVLAQRKYFRLQYPGVLVLTPPEPTIHFSITGGQAVLRWPAGYVGYTLETATNLAPPVIWQPLPGPYGLTNGAFELRTNLVTPPRREQYFRLRWP
jgi:hypothetical protein